MKFELSALCAARTTQCTATRICTKHIQNNTMNGSSMRHDLLVHRDYLPMHCATFQRIVPASNTNFAPPRFRSTSIDLLAHQWVFQTMKISYMVMGLIFVSQKPTCLCFSFGTFLILIQLCSSFFLVDFWLKWWKFCQFFAGMMALSFGKGWPGLHLKYPRTENFEIYMAIYYKGRNVEFSSKQSFEEKS